MISKSKFNVSQNFMVRVFISYAKEDVVEARNIFNYINNQTDFMAWLDEECLLPGMNWESEIMLALQEATLIALVISKNSLSKTGYVQKEVKKALDRLDYFPENKIFIIPIKIDNSQIKDPKLNKLQYLDFSKDREKAKSLLKKTLEHVINGETVKRNSNNIVFKQLQEVKNIEETVLLIDEPEILINTRKNLNFSGKDLSNKDFSNRTFTNANFKGANLIGTTFKKSKLISCNFSYANLERADLSECDLKGSNLSFTNFWRAKLSFAKNLEMLISCDYINIYGLNDSAAEEITLTGLTVKVLNLPDYNSYIQYFCSLLGITQKDFIQLFPWSKTDHFLNLFNKKNYK